MSIEIKNAKIDNTMLGYEGHGILSFMIYLDYGGGACQGFGGYALGKEYTTFVIEGILKTVGVEKWEDLPGKHIRVKLEDGRVVEIGNVLEDKWFNPKK
ncbi:MAG: hypothetical protein KJI69_04915 [Patescibacteria group bacterium]|nr:hypothetical protein [Patescibacteria group bacterium]